jgi:hypothetical protein
MYPYLALIPLALIFVGFAYRRRTNVHVPLMVGAILLDLVMIIQLEVNRAVVAKAIGAVTPLLKFHIAVAISAVLAYVVMIVTGILLLKGKLVRRPHKMLGLYVLVSRSIVSITAFGVV